MQTALLSLTLALILGSAPDAATTSWVKALGALRAPAQWASQDALMSASADSNQIFAIPVHRSDWLNAFTF
jgi:hypothetical protein